MKIELKPGDLFVVATISKIASLINWGQRIWSKYDNDAFYNHAGIILDAGGSTYESLLTIDRYTLARYEGRPIYIMRHCAMTDCAFATGLAAIEKYRGCCYPFWRLPLHLIGLAKFIHWTFPVCSELVGTFLNHAGLLKSTGWGWSPDDLADLWEESKNYQLIYKGIWNGLS